MGEASIGSPSARPKVKKVQEKREKKRKEEKKRNTELPSGPHVGLVARPSRPIWAVNASETSLGRTTCWAADDLLARLVRRLAIPLWRQEDPSRLPSRFGSARRRTSSVRVGGDCASRDSPSRHPPGASSSCERPVQADIHLTHPRFCPPIGSRFLASIANIDPATLALRRSRCRPAFPV